MVDEFQAKTHHRDTENTEVAQRNQYVATFCAKPHRDDPDVRKNYGMALTAFPSRQKCGKRGSDSNFVFGDAAASRERMLDHLSGKEKEDECPPSLIKNLLLAYAVLAAASL